MSEHPSNPQGEATTTTIGDEIAALLKEIRSLSRKLSLAKNGLKFLARKEPDPADFEAWLAAEEILKKETGIAEIDHRARAIQERLAPEIKKLRVKARMKFLATLDLQAGKEELAIERISESPLVLFIKPLTFEVDFDAGGARMLYGHEQIDDLPIDAHRFLQDRQKVLEKSRRQLVDPSDFFDLLHQAYKMVLASEGLEYGARVDVVDVLAPLSLLRAGTKTLRKKGIDALEPFPRYLLAMQLARQRRDGLLEKEGLRLDLGAATGGSTRNKEDVLFIPVGASSGQYSRSLRFERS